MVHAAGPRGRWIGARLPRLEDDRLLRGGGQYLADLRVEGALEAVFVRSPHAHAVIRSVDVSRALGAPGVSTVLVAADLPHVPLVDNVAMPALVKTPQPALAAERVLFVGEPVAVVIADSRARAEDAAELVVVDYEPLPPVLDPLSAGDQPPLHPHLDSNIIYDGQTATPGAERAFGEADHAVTMRFSNTRLSAVPLEGRACLADFDRLTGRLTVHASTQSPHLLQRKIATCLQIRLGQVRVMSHDVGGGFGQKIPASPEEIAIPLAARALGRPVRWVEDRRENLVAGPQAKDQILDLTLAFDESGEFRALRGQIFGDAGAYSFNSASALIEAYLASGLLTGPYRIPEVERSVLVALTTKSPVSPYRGVGWTAGHSARELLVDRVARFLGRDPFGLRRQNMLADSDFPYRTATGMLYDSGSHVEAMTKALDMVGGYEQSRGQTPDGHYRGVGISPYVEPSGWGSAGAGESQWSFSSHDSVTITMLPSGEVRAAVGTPSQGQGHATSLAQVVANVVGVHPSEVAIVAGDTDSTPFSTAGTRASRVATVTGGALNVASERLRDKLVAVAAHLLETEPDDLVFGDGQVRVAGTDAAIAIRDVAAAATFDLGVREALPSPELVATAFYDPPATYSNGCVAVVVAVDPGTGEITVERAAVAEDCGTVINPMIVEGQTLGAVVQGIGAALFEDAGYLEDGTPGGSTLAEYLLPTSTVVPRITLDHLASPSPFTKAGIKGMGESAMIATPGAVACAVADALAPLGVGIAGTPIHPGDLAERIATAQIPNP